MNASQSALKTFKLPAVVAAHIKPDPLEALRSPQLNQSFSEKSLARESVAGSEFNDIALDDESFSPVVLTARPPPIPEPSHSPETKEDTANRPKSVSFASPSTESVATKSHRKTASTTTIRSFHDGNDDSLFTRLDFRESNGSGPRGSVDGQLKLQEEFARLHEKEVQAHTTTEGVIDWDFWGAVISDYHAFASEHPSELADAIQKGIPATLRGMMWQHMAASKDPKLESTYLRLLKETSTHEKAITRDLGRTFPHHDFFTDGQGIGQENLFNVLKAYSLYDPQVGYCQGLPFIVAILLLNMPDEEAFSLLVRLMSVYDLQGHFLPEMPKLQLRLFQFDRLIEELLPVLHVHFLRQGVKSSMFCSQWFLTLFSYRFPLEIVFRIYDNCLANGIEAIFGFSVTLLKKNEEALLALKFDEILAFMNTKLFDCYLIQHPEDRIEGSGAKYRVDEFIQDAAALRITPFMLDCHRHEYEDLVRETNKHALQIDELRSSNRMLSNQLKTMENSLAQLNQEHVEILNELVKQRLRNEEIEEELVRYKLLYAEAMHQQEGANQSNRISLAQMMQSLKRGSS
ncbi:rab-GTPase-TBC domain-containing protein [Crassisporium funariophilum]|nr:rab-GTPase-TBC domain-containing protein [Crassisporium funariophilum]